MTKKHVQVELILGKKVVDEQGKNVGHIEEISVQKTGDEWIVKEYHVGSVAFIERLAVTTFAEPLIRMLRSERFPGGYVVPWKRMDLSDPEHPRLLGEREDLEPMSKKDPGKHAATSKKDK